MPDIVESFATSGVKSEEQELQGSIVMKCKKKPLISNAKEFSEMKCFILRKDTHCVSHNRPNEMKETETVGMARVRETTYHPLSFKLKLPASVAVSIINTLHQQGQTMGQHHHIIIFAVIIIC